MKGKVWLVGAGPGDPGLLTLRGREVLEQAEAVVFDRLVGDGIFAFIPEDAELIDVGKEGGRHPVPQEKIEDILIAKALEGKRVVRLKGGDPFVFGRGSEELEALIAHNIPFEVVPGVSAALAVPSCAGIPPTHRGLAASLHVITGHTRDGEIAPLDYEAIARLGGTLIFMMGIGALSEICSALIEAGMESITSAAVIERGTTARQRRIDGTLASMPEKVAEFNVKPPAVFVVGAVASLGERFDWKSELPLSGLRVVVTRPKERAGRLSRMLRDRGAEVIEYPCIATQTLPDAVLPSFEGADWLGFTSITGVESFFELLKRGGRDVRELGGAKVAAIGPATREALEQRGLRVDFMPSVYDGEHLAEGLADIALAGNKRVLMLRAQDGSPALSAVLKGRSVNFTEVKLYRTFSAHGRFMPADVDAAVFTSASTVRGFCEACPDMTMTDIKAVCIGIQTAQAAKEAGFSDILISPKATLEDLVGTLIDYELTRRC